tara:strand:+ start:137 stop:3157 length:3021 start_codon:yes stop_codon:yes gene_type:complete
MSLFQKSVITEYLKDISDAEINSGWEKIQDYQKMSSKVRDFKEEVFQASFLTKIFVECFGYKSQYDSLDEGNLFFEEKNISDSKKADGAIKKDNEVILVIELKGTKTKDLKSVETQAFGYKANHPKCEYVVTSNFEKLRFYVDNAVNYEEFDLFNLSKEDYRLLHLCLNSDNIFNGTPKKLKNESVIIEESITKKLYKDYSAFRNEIFNSLIETNTEYDKLLLFNKTQKLLDRFLFIFFAEDRNLVPANSISKIISKWEDDMAFGESRSLYSIFKQYFYVLNTGRPAKGKHESIFAYNGGLFATDEVLDKIEVDNSVLLKHTKNLSHYDFESEISVNILGHIFEHSLSEIEEIQNEISGKETETSKRKKDGVFYTPQYITQYIVENTLGKLCIEKKIQLDINEETYAPSSKRSRERIQALENYRNWLLGLTICDPACGSGAFLNQALSFLIDEHKYIDELSASYNKDSLILSDVKNSILENNLFGVDINQESVEIAKLSLWLRTAEKGRKLTSLNNNLKCGNSLIDDPEIAPENAFNWQNEFPDVFSKGGFDVIIGNPPYVDIKALDNDLVKALFEKYKTTENRINLYSIFIEKGYDILKKHGFLSFINPNSILVNSSYTKIRKMLLDDITSIIKLPDDVFEDATVETIIFELRKESSVNEVETIVYKKDEKIKYLDVLRKKIISKSNWKHNDNYNFNIYVNAEQFNLLQKIPKDSVDLGEISDFTLGITPYDKYKGHSQELIKSRGFHSETKESEIYKPLISGGNIERYFVSDEIKEYIKYGEWLGAPRDERFFNSPRILIRQIVSGKPPRIYSAYTEKSLYYTQIGFGIIPMPDTVSVKSLLAIINSKLINFYHKYSFLDLEKELFQKILIANCKKFPISNKLLIKPKLFDKIIDKMIELKEQENLLINGFVELLKSKFVINKPSKKLQNWFLLDFGILLKELKKLKLQLSLEDEAKWLQYFKSQKQKVDQLKIDIEKNEREIDKMVYELYGLTKEEIEIIENN